MKKRALILAVLLCLFLSQDRSLLFAYVESHEYRLNKQFLESFSHDFLAVTSSPKDWQEKDILRLAALMASGSIILAFDGNIRDWVHDKRSTASEDVFQVFSPLGHGLFLGSSLILLYAAGEVIEDCKLRKTALLGVESWLISGVIVTGLKFFTGRARPYATSSGSYFHPFSFKSRYHSFPSGHASSAFAVATIIADQSENLSVDILAYSLASMAALSRVHEDKHWASDILIGAAIGYFVSKKVSALNRKESRQNLKVSIRFSSQSQALTLTLFF
jgi:membrane-associated phospholipid phosphatase